MPEVRLIDRNALKSDLCSGCGTHDACVTVCRAIRVINRQPTIAAEPVKYAHWESWGFVFHGIEWKRCSACGKCAGVSYYGLLDGKIEMETPARCGCCGANMQTEPPEEVQE